MIRIRKPEGELVEVPDACFVEVTDAEGNIAEVTFQASNFEIKRINHSTKDTKTSYEKLYGVKFISKVIHV